MNTPDLSNATGGDLIGDGFFKLGYVTNDRDAAIEHMQKQLGIENFISAEATLEVRDAEGRTGTLDIQIAAAAGERLLIEIIQPVGGMTDVLTKPLSGTGGFELAFHHFGVMVDDLDAAKAEAGKRGIATTLEAHATPEVGEGPLAIAFLELPAVGHFLEYIQVSPAFLAIVDEIRAGKAPAPVGPAPVGP